MPKRDADYELRLPYANLFQHRMLRGTFSFLEGCLAGEQIRLNADFIAFNEHLPICRAADDHAGRMAWGEATGDSAFLAPAVAAACAFELDGTAGFPGAQLDWLLEHLSTEEFLAICAAKGKCTGKLIVKLAVFVPDPGTISPVFFDQVIPVDLDMRRVRQPLDAEEDTEAWHALWNIASPRGDADGLVFADMPDTESGFTTACGELVQNFARWFTENRLHEWRM